MDKSLPKKIWLAGLGAIARAEKEGEEWLESLMEEGEQFESEKKEDLDKALSSMTDKVKESPTRVREKFGNIENTFESKISNTLGKLGMVSRDELSSLNERLSALEAQLKSSSGG
jgi:poly(hydroxyalkanoate) granule-associated protein